MKRNPLSYYIAIAADYNGTIFTSTLIGISSATDYAPNNYNLIYIPMTRLGHTMDTSTNIYLPTIMDDR